MKNIIAIQGAEGSNYHKVVRDFYGDEVQLNECLSFDDLEDGLLDKTSDKGIMAIENTISGSIIPVIKRLTMYYDLVLLDQYLTHRNN